MKEITDLTKKYEDVFDAIHGKSKLQMLKEVETETKSSSLSRSPLIQVRK
jgi:hypothetical protein